MRFRFTGFDLEMNNLLRVGVTFGSPAGLVIWSTASSTLKPRTFSVPPQWAAASPGAPHCHSDGISPGSGWPGTVWLAHMGTTARPRTLAMEPECDAETTLMEQSLGYSWRHLREATGGGREGPPPNRRRRGPQGGSSRSVDSVTRFLSPGGRAAVKSHRAAGSQCHLFPRPSHRSSRPH